MRILAIDVGTGTQDIMIYDTQKELENIVDEYRMIGVRIRGIILTEDGTKLGKFISYIKIL